MTEEINIQFFTEELCIYFFALVCTAIFLPFYIKELKRRQVEQFVRQEGPTSHATKNKTPTTGGVIFALTTLIWLVYYRPALNLHADKPLILAASALAFFCALLGAWDDFTKIANKSNRGITARMRLFIEMALGLVFGIIVLKFSPQSTSLLTHHGFLVLPPWIFLLLSIFLVAATTNAVNLHDGMDGLAGGTTSLILISLAIMLWYIGHYNLSMLTICCAGALGGFLLFNRYPAKIFMGDTGSLFLGGLLAAIILASGLTLWFIPLALIYILETLSVIAQVAYFKLTKPAQGSVWFKLTHKLPGEGKRLFRMAPLHHHFEAVFAEKGIPEWQVVLGFWFAQLALCASVLAVFFAF